MRLSDSRFVDASRPVTLGRSREPAAFVLRVEVGSELVAVSAIGGRSDGWSFAGGPVL
jgi:hypothetical protein